ncbi:ATP nucleotide 3'-pyrophosphokinase [Streptomyces yokosukanensis]|uniref:ATP nucleotide 3'-pyrophosphokinase n=1 Tax=Streptomyces yokosukanensis TaxID=67386 RepID=A0A117PZ96_9ACTN|nr:ATP nucleotide 3'-pyrophosphokinase [Streptomyces yokosukanensis]KUM99098.1 ATP nucleotide 3'-pyrophosphokinase [Streptomyces yokosukanensis]
MSTHHLGRAAAVLAAALTLATATTGLTAYAADPYDTTGKRATAMRSDGGAGQCDDAPDGWEGDGLCLNAADNRKVDAYLARARAAEPSISHEVRAAAVLSKAELVGFDYRLKSPDSLKRKVATDLKEHPERNTDDVLARLGDAVRYTLQWPDGRYVKGVTIASTVLSGWGNDTTKWSNTWGREKGYKGLNTGWRAPGSRQLFEVQFHTPASKFAQEATHKLYEEQRLPSTSPERKKELQHQQDAIFAAVPVPDGAPALSSPTARPASAA